MKFGLLILNKKLSLQYPKRIIKILHQFYKAKIQTYILEGASLKSYKKPMFMSFLMIMFFHKINEINKFTLFHVKNSYNNF